MADAQIKILINGIHVSFERLGISTTGGMLQHWDVNLYKALFHQKFTGGLPELTASNKALPDVVIDAHVHIAAAQTLFFVSEAFLGGWRGAQGLG